jgi:hypothetical protein
MPILFSEENCGETAFLPPIVPIGSKLLTISANLLSETSPLVDVLNSERACSTVYLCSVTKSSKYRLG